MPLRSLNVTSHGGRVWARKIAMSKTIVSARVTMRKPHRPLFVTIFLVLGLSVGPSARANAAEAQQTFDCPKAAVNGLVTAAENGDMKPFGSILGSDPEPILIRRSGRAKKRAG